MGTSSSYGGPGRGGSLLPPWAEPVGDSSSGTSTPAGTEQTPTPPPAPTLTWSAAKSRLTRFGASSGSGSAAGRRLLRRAASGYVRAQGGARVASRNAAAGRRSAQALGG